MLKDKDLFLKAETQTALWLPWDTVGQLIGDKLEKLLQMTFHVRAEYRDADYWYCEFGMNYIDIFTQERLFMAIDAIEDERQEMMGMRRCARRQRFTCQFTWYGSFKEDTLAGTWR